MSTGRHSVKAPKKSAQVHAEDRRRLLRSRTKIPNFTTWTKDTELTRAELRAYLIDGMVDESKSWSDRGNVANRRISYHCGEGHLQKLPSGRFLAIEVLRWMYANWPDEYRPHPTIRYGSAAGGRLLQVPMPTTLEACHAEIAALRDALQRERLIRERLEASADRASVTEGTEKATSSTKKGA
jgi:hypothetical protein